MPPIITFDGRNLRDCFSEAPALPQDHTGYSSDEADRGYDRPGTGNGSSTAAASSLGPKRAENGGSGHGGGGGEARLVDQICTPGGLRAQPTREDLRIFVESAGSMNGDALAQLLEAKMVRAIQCEIFIGLFASTAMGHLVGFDLGFRFRVVDHRR
jgi:hypothetical protein